MSCLVQIFRNDLKCIFKYTNSNSAEQSYGTNSYDEKPSTLHLDSNFVLS